MNRKIWLKSMNDGDGRPSQINEELISLGKQRHGLTLNFRRFDRKLESAACAGQSAVQ